MRNYYVTKCLHLLLYIILFDVATVLTENLFFYEWNGNSVSSVFNLFTNKYFVTRCSKIASFPTKLGF